MHRSIAGLLAIAGAALASAGCQPGFFAVINAGAIPETVSVEADQTYDTGTGLMLDVYRPKESVSAPIAVFFYGGRWQEGSRREYAFVGKALAASGIVAVVPDYREYPAVKFPAFIEDAAHAVAWTHARAAMLGGDASRLYVAGHSAGAHIAALLGVDRRYLAAQGLEPRILAGVIGIAGPYDFLPITKPDLAEIFGPPERYPESQPVGFVDGDEPPFLLLHGGDDRLVWPRNSESLARRLEAAGIAHQLTIYPEIGHVRILAAMDLDHRSLAPTLTDVLRFIGGDMHTGMLR